jgi:DNA-binding beta-propeller fold protein YncE
MRRRDFLCATATTGIVVACRAKRGEPFPGYAFVANYEAKTVAVVDLTAFSVTRQIRLDDGPTGLAMHPSKGLVYVLTPASGFVHEIDTAKMAVVRKVRAVSSAVSMRFSAADDTPALWVLGTDRRLARVDVDTFHVAGSIGLPGQGTDFDLSNWTKLAAVGYADSGTATLIDLRTGNVGKPVRVSDAVGAVRFRSDGKMLIVADTAGRALSLLQAPGGRLVSRLMLAVRPDNLCFSTDNGGQLFVTGDGADAVVVVYPFKVPEVAETALAGRAPGPMAASKSFLFVANPGAGDVSIFDIATHKTIAVAAVGAEPRYIVITPDDQFALVLNEKSGDVAVIKMLAIRNDRTKAAALFTMIPVGSKPVAAVVRAV